MKRRSYFAWLRIGFSLHVGILVLLFGGLFGVIAFQSYQRQWRYAPVQGTILKSVMEPCDDGMFSVEVSFSYTIDRRRYTGGKYRDDFGKICRKEAEAAEIVARFPQGATVDAWYDPKNPSQAVIDRSLGMLHYISIAVISGFTVIFALAWMFNRRGRRTQREGIESS